MGQRTSPRHHIVEDDGGFRCIFDPPRNLPKDVEVAIRITAEGHHQWCGYLGIMADMGGELRYWKHVPFQFKKPPDPTPAERIKALEREIRKLKGAEDEPSAELPMPNSDPADLDAIQDFRTLWNRHGAKAAEELRSVFLEMKGQLHNDGVYWEGLLQPEIAELEVAIKAMDEAAAADTRLSASGVRGSFNALYKAYLNACKWVARVEASGDVALDDVSVLATIFEVWTKAHGRFRDKLLDMNEKPVHKDTLEIFFTVPEETLSSFLSRAESDPPGESSSVRHELQAMSIDVRGAVEGAQAVLGALGHLLSGDESKNEVEQGRGSLDALTLGLDSGESAEELQDLLHCLYIDYQRVREWIAECIQRGGALMPGGEVGNVAFAWWGADQHFLGTLDHLLPTDAFAKLAYYLRDYDGPNPTFGPVKSAGGLGFGLVGDDTTTPSTPDTEAPQSPKPAPEDPET